jgi:hypothetical protein
MKKPKQTPKVEESQNADEKKVRLRKPKKIAPEPQPEQAVEAQVVEATKKKRRRGSVKTDLPSAALAISLLSLLYECIHAGMHPEVIATALFDKTQREQLKPFWKQAIGNGVGMASLIFILPKMMKRLRNDEASALINMMFAYFSEEADSGASWGVVEGNSEIFAGIWERGKDVPFVAESQAEAEEQGELKAWKERHRTRAVKHQVRLESDLWTAKESRDEILKGLAKLLNVSVEELKEGNPFPVNT